MEFDDVQASYEPGDAAHRLGVSASGLRRLAAAYEAVHGDLPRKIGTKARLYPEVALAEIAQARTLIEAGRYNSNIEALDALKHGLELETPAELIPNADQATPQALALFIEEQREMRQELRALHEEILGLKALPQAAPVKHEHGPLVRAALWLEAWLSRLR